MRGDGTTLGSRPSPTHRNATRTTKIPSGVDQRQAFMRSARSVRRSASAHFAPGNGGLAPDRKPIAPIGDRHESAERHQKGSAPDPIDERLDVDAQGPCAGDILRTACTDGFAERYIAVAENADLDRGDGHRLARCVVDTFLGLERLDEAAVLANLDRARDRAIVGPRARDD